MTKQNPQNLPNATDTVTIPKNPDDQKQAAAGAGTPEDTTAFTSEIDIAGQQAQMMSSLQEQNQLLIEQNKRLNDQIGLLLRNGASITDDEAVEQDEDRPMPEMNPDTGKMYKDFCDLGKEI